MDKMLVAVFDSEKDAYRGLDSLQEIDATGDITLYATAVVTKDLDGTVDVRQADDIGPVGTMSGILAGGMVGALAGPAGAAAGAAASAAATGAAVGGAAGGISGLASELSNEGVNVDFVDDVSEVLIPGKSALLAEVDEYVVTPVNTRLQELGGIVFRRPRYQVVDDQLADESAAFHAEVKELQEEVKEGNEASKAEVKKTLNSVKKRLEVISDKANEKMDQINKEAETKEHALEAQMKKARAEQKAKIEKRIAEVKADQKKRTEKLQEARELAQQALAA